MKQSIRYVNRNGIERVFKTETNILNGEQMYWIENDPAMYHGKKRDVKKIIKNIISEFKIIGYNNSGLDV